MYNYSFHVIRHTTLKFQFTAPSKPKMFMLKYAGYVLAPVRMLFRKHVIDPKTQN